jgi:hypothetical protein
MNHTSRKFWAQYNTLPGDVRALADKNYRLLEESPRHPSLQLKRVGHYWSVRVSENFRAVGVDVDDGILWIWIGPHRDYERFIQS